MVPSRNRWHQELLVPGPVLASVEMGIAPRLLVSVMVAIAVLGVPFAWASGNCAVMGVMCDGPCAASSGITVDGPSVGPMLLFAANISVHKPGAPPNVILTVLELPPKSSLLSV